LDATTAKRMKIGQYCQRQRCMHVELDFGMLSRRAGLLATAGLSCSNLLISRVTA